MTLEKDAFSGPETPVWMRYSVVILAIFILLSLLFSLLAPWQQTSQGGGKLTAYAPQERRQEIHAPISGRVVHWYVHEGQRVKAGDKIADLQDLDSGYQDRLTLNRKAYLAQREAARAQTTAYDEQVLALKAAKSRKLAAATQKIAGARQQELVAEQEVQAALVAYQTAQANLSRVEQMTKEGLMADRKAELARMKAADTLAKLQTRRAKRTEAGAKVSEMMAMRESIDAEQIGRIAKAQAQQRKAQAEEAKSDVDLVKIDVAVSRQEEQHILAPRDGVVQWVKGNHGANVVKAGALLAILVPDVSTWGVELWIRGRDIPLVQQGRKVRLQFEGWPAVQVVGWPQVAIGTFGGIVAFVDAIPNAKGLFRVMVTQDPQDLPWPQAPHVRQGGRAKGWILLDQVPLGFEVWRRINGFPLGLQLGAKDAPNAKGKGKSK